MHCTSNEHKTTSSNSVTNGMTYTLRLTTISASPCFVYIPFLPYSYDSNSSTHKNRSASFEYENGEQGNKFCI